jgi:mRNA interferase YafQ
MLKPRFTGPFKRERKLMRKRGMDINRLTVVLDMIINEQPLPPERNNHQLHGKWKDMLSCHIQSDWALVYEIDPAARTVTFHHTGSHSDLF